MVTAPLAWSLVPCGGSATSELWTVADEMVVRDSRVGLTIHFDPYIEARDGERARSDADDPFRARQGVRS